jgi:hypothetical protein
LLRNCLLKHVIEGKIEGWLEGGEVEEGDVGMYWMNLSEGEDIGI